MSIKVYGPCGTLLAVERSRPVHTLAQQYPVGAEFHTPDVVYINEPTRVAFLRTVNGIKPSYTGDMIVFAAALILWPLALLV